MNFIGNNASLVGSVLNVSRMAWQDKVVLRYGAASTDKDLAQGSNGQLLWNSAELATTAAMATLLAKLMNGCSVSSNAVLSRSGNGGAMLSRFSAVAMGVAYA